MIRTRLLFRVWLVAPLLVGMLAVSPQGAGAASGTTAQVGQQKQSVVRAAALSGTQPYVSLTKHSTASDFSGSAASGVVVGGTDTADIHLASSGLTSSGKKTDKKLYTRAPYWYGTLESPAIASRYAFDTLIPSWNAYTPAGTWIQMELRAIRASDGHSTPYYNLGVWASGTDTIQRHSVDKQSDTDGWVATDTLYLRGNADYTHFQYRLTLFTTDPSVSPHVRLVSVMTSNSYLEANGYNLESDRDAWGTNLSVPQRSQMIYPNGGEVWCSPTSTSMVLAYWGAAVPVPQAADETYDYVYQGNGNWPFNTAWAAAHTTPDGTPLEAYVTRLSSMSQVEEWISSGVPVVVSFAFAEGELAGTPIPSSGGHLMVIRGFDSGGNVIVNDPAAASDAEVQITYDREDLERLWLTHSGGTVYLIYPKGHAVPSAEKSFGSW